MNICTKTLERGQSLVELVVVIGMVILTLTALIAATTSSLHNTTSDKTRSIAVKYAEEGIEIVRRERDKSWEALSGLADENNGLYCLGKDETFIPGPCTSPNLGVLSYIRSVTLVSVATPTPPTPPYLSVTVSVSSGDTSQTIPVTITTRLTQWK